MLKAFRFHLFLGVDDEVLSITNTLSTALQNKDRDLVNACAIITTSKQENKYLRDEGFSRIFWQALTFGRIATAMS